MKAATVVFLVVLSGQRTNHPKIGVSPGRAGSGTAANVA